MALLPLISRFHQLTVDNRTPNQFVTLISYLSKPPVVLVSLSETEATSGASALCVSFLEIQKSKLSVYTKNWLIVQSHLCTSMSRLELICKISIYKKLQGLVKHHKKYSYIGDSKS